LLQFRLNQAKDGYKEPRLFTTPGLWAIYRATKGYPRKIIHLSHRVLLTMIIQNRSTAGWFLVRWCARMMVPPKPRHRPWRQLSLGAVLVGLVLLAAFALQRSWSPFSSDKARLIKGTIPSRAAPAVESQPSRRVRIPEPLNAVVAPERQASEEQPAAKEATAPQNETAPAPIGTPPAAADQLAAPATPSQEETQAEQPAPAADPLTPAPLPETLAEAPPETLRETPPVEFHPPEVLGQVTTRPGDTLERMIRRIYGVFDQSYLKAVMQLNPQITDFNALDVGKAIKFPPLPVRANPLPKGGRYVQVSQANTLNEACKVLRSYPVDAPQVFLLPHWNPGDGLKFGLVLKDCCPDQQTAETTLSTLPPSMATRAKIIGKEDEQAVFLVR
jgi:general secretion pathway protein A